MRWMDRYRGTRGLLGRIVCWFDVRWLRREVRRQIRKRS